MANGQKVILGLTDSDEAYRKEALDILRAMHIQWVEALKEIGAKTGHHGGSRTLSLSQTKMDEALMWARGHLEDKL